MDFPFGQYVSAGEGSGWTVILAGVEIDRIGVQASPGVQVKINSQLMTIGRTGLFELETDINKIEIDNSKKYIIDYHIKEE